MSVCPLQGFKDVLGRRLPSSQWWTQAQKGLRYGDGQGHRRGVVGGVPLQATAAPAPSEQARVSRAVDRHSGIQASKWATNPPNMTSLSAEEDVSAVHSKALIEFRATGAPELPVGMR